MAGNLAIQDIVKILDLKKHVEGGYYKRVYESGRMITNEDDASRKQSKLLTSINYLLTSEAPISAFCKNESTIIHFYHMGDPTKYFVIHPDGHLETCTIGPDLHAGHKPQFAVEGGMWKCSTLEEPSNHGYSLISEAVAPGFEFSEWQLGEYDELIKLYPQHKCLIKEMFK